MQQPHSTKSVRKRKDATDHESVHELKGARIDLSQYNSANNCCLPPAVHIAEQKNIANVRLYVSKNSRVNQSQYTANNFFSSPQAVYLAKQDENLSIEQECDDPAPGFAYTPQ